MLAGNSCEMNSLEKSEEHGENRSTRLAFWLRYFQAFKFQRAHSRRLRGEDSISLGFVTAKGE